MAHEAIDPLDLLESRLHGFFRSLGFDPGNRNLHRSTHENAGLADEPIILSRKNGREGQKENES
jgi:hypothetical protein